MSRQRGFVAHGAAGGFTAHSRHAPRLPRLLMQCTAKRHVSLPSFSFDPSPRLSSLVACSGYYGLCRLLAPVCHRRPFRHKARSPQVRTRSFTARAVLAVRALPSDRLAVRRHDGCARCHAAGLQSALRTRRARRRVRWAVQVPAEKTARQGGGAKSSSSSASRADVQASRSRLWHRGQWRFLHECQRHCWAPQPSQRWCSPPSAGVRQATMARQARAWAVLTACQRPRRPPKLPH